MNWDAIGAIGETVGAVAVIATLFYLATQIRQSNRAVEESLRSIRLDSTRSTVESFARYRALISQPDLADIYLRGLSNYGSLSDVERIQFGAVVDEYLFCYSAMHQRMLEGTYERHAWESHTSALREFFANPGAAEWWGIKKHKFPLKFVSELDSI